MAFDWKSLVSSVAPTIGTALGGPMGGLAAKAVTAALGIDDNASEREIEKAIKGATPEQLLAIKKADQEFEVRLKELDIDLERVNQADRASARDMQKENKSYIVPLLATITVGSFFGVVFWVLSGKVTLESTLLGFVLGQVSSKAEQVYNFFFGSSHGSKQKTEAMTKGR